MFCSHSHAISIHFSISYVMNGEGTDPYPSDASNPNCFHCDGFFTGTEDDSWQKVHGVKANDAAIVIANALAHRLCAQASQYR